MELLLDMAFVIAIVLFVVWRLYFREEENLRSAEPTHVFERGYSHFIISALAATLGAGFAALVFRLHGEKKV